MKIRVQKNCEPMYPSFRTLKINWLLSKMKKANDMKVLTVCVVYCCRPSWCVSVCHGLVGVSEISSRACNGSEYLLCPSLLNSCPTLASCAGCAVVTLPVEE